MMNVPNLNKKTAFVIGNGKSRENVQLENLRNYGTVFGCNALYRDWYPDYLVAIDPGMIGEIENSDFPKERFIVPPLDEQYEPPEIYSLPANASTPRSNAGMNAMSEAVKMGFEQLVMIGFDFIVASEDVSMSNVYADTVNYGPETKTSFHDAARRMHYLNWFIDQHENVDFYFTYPTIEGGTTIWEFACEKTVGGLNFEEFHKIYK
jgi:hypothetical protein